jgi:antitoxin (DNA-binding transcriptional repressor) of toxin-antitoxin stability system
MENSWPVQDAKARFSELLRAAEAEPQTITYRGEPKFELRLKPQASRSTKNTGLPRWWVTAPRVPEFKLPPRKREKMRKISF